MKIVDFSIDQEDLKVLYVKTKHAYGNLDFEKWVKQVKNAYSSFVKNKNNPKSFSDWVNGQIIYLN